MSTMDHDDFDRLLNEVEQMDDDALDAVVARAAADYNAPPAGQVQPPVEAMWTRIAATQRPARHGGLRVQRWQLLAASVAFVAFGITIGRQWSRTVEGSAHAGAPAVTRVTPAAETPRITPPAVAATPSEAPAVASTQIAASTETHSPSHSASHSSSHAAPRVSDGASSAVPSVASNGASNAASNAASNGASYTTPRSDAAYQMATMRHFAAAEALLASYDGSARDAKTDAQLASWAGDLLSQTRLLLDSPAGRDPVRRRLLQDLELVLVQMAQLNPDASKRSTLEHDLIDGSVRHNDIITRLRTAVPAGATTVL